MIWTADERDGFYRNPILYEDFSDPDVCLGKDAYYMTASSFSFVPGLPILKSYDLVHWRLVNYALRKIPEFRYREPIHGCGVWAPSIRFHEGRYYIVFPMPDEGLYKLETEDPEGEWSEPVKLYDGAGLIDPCPFFDEDGRVYLVNGVAKSRIGYKSVLMMSELSADLTHIIKGPVPIYDGTGEGNITIEGPKLYRRGDYYYIFAPAGGVKTGWQTVLRSKNLFSGWESHISMKQGSTGVNGPHQGALITDGSGKGWFIHFQDVFALGRITHLQPVTWIKDSEGEWPIIGKAIEGESCGEPVLSEKCPTPIREENINEEEESKINDYSGTNPPLPWQWNANPEESWLSVPAKDTISLQTVCAPMKRPLIDLRNLLLRRISAPELTFEAVLDLCNLTEGSFAGICISGMTYGGIGIYKKNNHLFVRMIKGHQIFDCGAAYADENAENIPLPEGYDMSLFHVKVRISNSNGVTATSFKPPYGIGDEKKVLHPEEIAELSICPKNDGKREKEFSMSFPLEAGRWTGAKYGFFGVTESKDKVCPVNISHISLK